MITLFIRIISMIMHKYDNFVYMCIIMHKYDNSVYTHNKHDNA